MRTVLAVTLVGLAAGILDLIPLLLVDAPLYNMLSIVAFWLSATLIITSTSVVKNAALNGLLIATILMLPMALAVSASNAKDFAPMMLMAVVLGPIVGFVVSRLLRGDAVAATASQ